MGFPGITIFRPTTPVGIIRMICGAACSGRLFAAWLQKVLGWQGWQSSVDLRPEAFGILAHAEAPGWAQLWGALDTLTFICML